MNIADILISALLGIVQGLTEFLPVSSSAHLNIMPWLFNWEITDSFDLALHAGTLFAILIYFFNDWIKLIRGGVRQVVKRENTSSGRIFWYIILSTIPAGVLGILLEKAVGKLTGGNLNIEMIIISFALIIMGILLYVVDKRSPSTVDYKHIGFKQGFLIGVSQAIAGAVPGVSRSGITMTVARGMHIDRESAAKYSFLLSAPMIAAAVLVSIKDFTFNAAFFVGVITSFLSGMLVIKFLMGYLKKGSYKIFAVYRIVLGVVIMGIAIFRIFR